MVATSRPIEPDHDPDDGRALPSMTTDATETSLDILRGAMRAFEAAQDERVRLQKVAKELAADRLSLDRSVAEFEMKMARAANDEVTSRHSASRDTIPSQSVLRSLQFVAGCALAGVVLTGAVLGHDIHGFDPGYVGGAIGLLAGGGVWAIRGL